MTEYDLLASENAQLRRVLARLTEREPRVQDRETHAWRCGVCSAPLDWGHGFHAPSCAWAEARQLLEIRPRPAAVLAGRR